MTVSLLTILSLGFILGIKHALEPDHLIAVSTIASTSKNLWRSSLAGVFWGIGHTATLFFFGIIIILLKGEIPSVLAMSLEFLVGMMLVYLGITSILSFKKINNHPPVHNRPYTKAVLIGLIHGLAGSAAMVLLTMSTVTNIWQAAVYIFIFGTGTVAGMLLFTTIVGIPFVLSNKKTSMNKVLSQLAGTISIVFGVFYMYNIGVTERLFFEWRHFF